MQLIPLPAFSDNYIWLLHNGRDALVVDPGEAAPVIQALQHSALQLRAILVTHHHPDHVGGVAALRQASGAVVYGPGREHIPEPFEPLAEGDVVNALGLTFRVLDVPGHTAGHIAFYCEAMEGQPLLFCGDTLFSGGCGRIFEGTPAQMLSSLDRLAALPDHTRVCCTHEYTLSNLRFALAVEPDNHALQAYVQECTALRERQQPTLPSTLLRERQINPFLRSRLPGIIKAVQTQDDKARDDVAVFAALRQWKNEFR